MNLTRIPPGGESALMHLHSKQDELVYVLEGEAVLATPSGETRLSAGMCAGFPARGEAHHILNDTDRDVVILEIGDRPEGDEGSYPQDDPQAVMGADGQWRFTARTARPTEAKPDSTTAVGAVQCSQVSASRGSIFMSSIAASSQAMNA